MATNKEHRTIKAQKIDLKKFAKWASTIRPVHAKTQPIDLKKLAKFLSS